MATNQNNQSFLNKSRSDKFTLVFSLPPALRKIDSKTDRTSFNVNEDAFQFSVFGAVVPEINCMVWMNIIISVLNSHIQTHFLLF